MDFLELEIIYKETVKSQETGFIVVGHPEVGAGLLTSGTSDRHLG